MVPKDIFFLGLPVDAVIQGGELALPQYREADEQGGHCKDRSSKSISSVHKSRCSSGRKIIDARLRENTPHNQYMMAPEKQTRPPTFQVVS